MIFFFTYVPWIANRADPSTRFFFSKSRKSLTSKKDFQNHHRKPKLTPNGSASSAVGCFISFTYSKHAARSAASALSLIYYYWLQGCSNRVMEILDWLPEPRMDPFRLPGSNGSSWMTGGRRRVQQQEHTRTPNMLRQHGTTLTRIPNNSLRLLFPFFFFYYILFISGLTFIPGININTQYTPFPFKDKITGIAEKLIFKYSFLALHST